MMAVVAYVLLVFLGGSMVCTVKVAAQVPISGPPSNTDWTAYYDAASRVYSVSAGHDPVNGVATAEFGDERSSSGWARLTITTNPIYEDGIAMFGAGYLEGVITASMVWENWYNIIQSSMGGNVPTALLDWFRANLAWVYQQIKLHSATVPYWRHVELMINQLQGLQQGYSSVYGNTNRALTIEQFILLNSDGDTEELCVMFNCSGVPGMARRAKTSPIQNSHYSSFVRVTPDLKELFTAHSTWGEYYGMVRMFKKYDFQLRAKQTTSRSTLFSSYPSFISSVDDFYQLSSGLVVTETTNGIYTSSLFSLIKPQSVLSWIRVSVANRMASSGDEWIKIFMRYNSGTYNNQWIVVNYNLFNPGEPLPDGVLYIAEQIPGRVEHADVTHYLRLGYWPSYNIPFFESIYNASGFVEQEETYGDWFNYQMHPRAYIFRRDAVKVNDVAGARKLIRYNNWKEDPASYGNPGNQIAARFDLVPKNDHPTNPNLVREAFGGIDAKLTCKALVNLGRVQAQSGPSHDQQPPFVWNDADWPGVSHLGQPKVWNFGWVEMPSGRELE